MSDDRSKTELVIEAVEQRAELFHDQFKDAYAAVTRKGGHTVDEVDGEKAVERTEWRDIMRIDSDRFSQWTANLVWLKHGDTLPTDAQNTAANSLQGRARYEGSRKELHNRTARRDGAIWYDLADEYNRAVKITADGWTVTQPPILFRRYGHQREQAMPEDRGTDMDALFQILNPCLDDDQRLLLKVQLVANYIPGFPHPIICPHGPQGSAKTFMCMVLRELVDPSELETLQYTTNITELTQKVAHHWFPAFDNITSLPRKVSDFFCRAVTGQGFSKRQLYTDDEDIIYRFKRPVALNGINTVPQKPDLLDRTILYELERIPKAQRATEQELTRKLQELKPGLLARIFDVISDAMAMKPGVDLPETPRMADFAVWGEAISRAMGHNENEFLRAYMDNIGASNVEAVEAHILGEAVVELVDRHDEWQGTPTETLDELEDVADDLGINTNQKKWPSAPNWVSRRLNEVKPNLQAMGINVDIGDREDSSTRRITISNGDAVTTVTTVTGSGPYDSNDGNDSTTDNKGGNAERILDVIDQVDTGDGAPIEDVQYASDLDGDVIEDALDDMETDGAIYKPKPDRVKRL